MKYKLVRKDKFKPDGSKYEVLYLFGDFNFIQGFFICHTKDNKEFYKPFKDLSETPKED